MAAAARILASQPPAIDFASAAPAAVQETDHLTLAVPRSPAAAPGSRVSLFLHVTPKPKMHVYAPGQKTYLPVSVRVTDDPILLTVHAPTFPRAEKYFFKPLNETQLVYSKPFRIVQDVTLAKASASYHASSLTITGTLRYQACDDQICYLPRSLAVTWQVPLTIPTATK